jgi:hypothetical protein
MDPWPTKIRAELRKIGRARKTLERGVKILDGGFSEAQTARIEELSIRGDDYLKRVWGYSVEVSIRELQLLGNDVEAAANLPDEPFVRYLTPPTPPAHPAPTATDEAGGWRQDFAPAIYPKAKAADVALMRKFREGLTPEKRAEFDAYLRVERIPRVMAITREAREVSERALGRLAGCTVLPTFREGPGPWIPRGAHDEGSRIFKKRAEFDEYLSLAAA